MRIALAPNAFRGSLSAFEAIACLERGLQASQLAARDLHCRALPLADGGDGTLEVLLHGLGGSRLRQLVHNPRGHMIHAEYGISSDGTTAIIEMSRASGLELLSPPERDPLYTSSYGTGELIAAAVARGCRQIILGIGGSATVEGGAGCLQALGARLWDAHGSDLPQGGAGLLTLARMDVSAVREKLAGVQITILCDVHNPLLGDLGAAAVFGPQKGASPAEVQVLERALSQFADVLARDCGRDVRAIAGGGAAGGISAGLIGVLGDQVRLVSGAQTLLGLLKYDDQLEGVDLLITGEGKLDSQTSGGKAVQIIAQAAAGRGIPVIAICGAVMADAAALAAMGITAAFSIVPGVIGLEAALSSAAENLTFTAQMLGNLLAI